MVEFCFVLGFLSFQFPIYKFLFEYDIYKYFEKNHDLFKNYTVHQLKVFHIEYIKHSNRFIIGMWFQMESFVFVLIFMLKCSCIDIFLCLVVINNLYYTWQAHIYKYDW